MGIVQTGTCKVRQSLTDTEEHAVILLTFLVDWDNWPAGIHWLGIRHVTYVVAGDGNPHRIRAEVGARARDFPLTRKGGGGLLYYNCQGFPSAQFATLNHKPFRSCFACRKSPSI